MTRTKQLMAIGFVTLAVFASAGALQAQHPAAGQTAIQPLRYAPQEWFVPPHVAGDADFHGNGPRVWLGVDLYIHPQARNQVWARVQMQAIETKHDWTASGGVKNVHVATFARPLTRILSPTHLPYGLIYIDTDHHVDQIQNPSACGVVNVAYFRGDGKGDDAGVHTGVLLRFNPVLAQ